MTPLPAHCYCDTCGGIGFTHPRLSRNSPWVRWGFDTSESCWACKGTGHDDHYRTWSDAGLVLFRMSEAETIAERTAIYMRDMPDDNDLHDALVAALGEELRFDDAPALDRLSQQFQARAYEAPRQSTQALIAAE